MKLKDRVAVVTGAGSGIGAASALAMASEGARVLVVDIDEAGAKTTVEAIERVGGRAAAAHADVTRAADNQAIVEQAVAAWGSLDIFFANAGVPQWPSPLEDVDEAVFDRIMAVNVKGVWLGARSALTVMKRQKRGVFLITASTAAIRPRPGGQTYAASKGAVVTLAKSLALESAPHGVRVVAIAPVATDRDAHVADLHGRSRDRRRQPGALRRHRASRPAQPARGHRAYGRVPRLRRGHDDHGHLRGGGRRALHLSRP
jgi:3-oxoacyl-[acyl-carrier protein] reductase